MALQTKASVVVLVLIGLGAAIVLGAPISAHAATLRLSPASGSYTVGHSFTVDVLVDSSDQAMNAAQGTITFPAGLLHVISVSTDNSIVNLWVEQPSFSNKNGQVDFQGVVVNPGFSGTGGKIITITFQAVVAGTAPVKFSAGSVLANDGAGTEILDGFQGARYTVLAAAAGVPPIVGPTAIVSDPLIASGTWYNMNTIGFAWDMPSAVTGVDYAIATDPNYQLPEVSKGTPSATSYDLTALNDGQWYFFLSLQDPGGWSVPVVRSFLIDHTPPDPFIIIREDQDLYSSEPRFQWIASDKTSGIAYYLVKIGDGDWFNASVIQMGTSSIYKLPPQSPTDSRTLTVRAFDKAGNSRDATVSFEVAALPPTCGSSWIIINCVVTDFLRAWAWLVFLLGLLFYLLACLALYRLFAWKKDIQENMHDFQSRINQDMHNVETELASIDNEAFAESFRQLGQDLKRGLGRQVVVDREPVPLSVSDDIPAPPPGY